jgi:hypothetical protein
LISGERLEGVLSDSRVHVEKDENGDYKEETSRIGLIVGDGTFNIQPTPVFSRNILSIMGSEE